jgi:P4 family phage/plasmid primase-like protien
LSASVALDAGGLRAASAAGPQSTVSVCAVGSAAQTAPELQRFALSGPGCSGCLAAARPNLIRWRGDWFDYVGSHYRDVEREAIRADLWAYCPHYEKKHIDELEDALRGVVLKDRDAAAPPCWLSVQSDDPPADELLACRNGILHLPTLRFMPHTPRLFTRNAIAVDFDPEAPEPVEWLRFLDTAWGDDHEQVRLLQEIIGYLVSVDTSMQKFFMLLGPTRSGKGIITRMVTKLIGKRNVCSPTLDSIGTRFGLETALGKTLATISDMRLGQRTDRQNIVGNLLRIVGEDDVDVERKHIGGAWTGKLGIRFLISTNLPPALPDVSGALVGRLIAVKMTESFLGREDREMERRLERELPGILVWAAGSWRRLREQRDFTETRAGKELRERMRLLASPLQGFVEDACRIAPDGRVRKEDIWPCRAQLAREPPPPTDPPRRRGCIRSCRVPPADHHGRSATALHWLRSRSPRQLISPLGDLGTSSWIRWDIVVVPALTEPGCSRGRLDLHRAVAAARRARHGRHHARPAHRPPAATSRLCPASDPPPHRGAA